MYDPTGKLATLEWIKGAFQPFLSDVTEQAQFAELSTMGISVLRGAPLIRAVLSKSTDGIKEEQNAHFEQLAVLAQREIDRGFPLLHAQATISLWASLEALIEDFLVMWLTNVPAARQLDAVQKIKVSLADYASMNDDERQLHIIQEVEKDIKATFKMGIERFECLLGLFGLSGEVDQETKKNLFEMSNVRNVMVHRRGKADKRIIKSCPWMDLQVGDQITISQADFMRYSGAVSQYADYV